MKKDLRLIMAVILIGGLFCAETDAQQLEISPIAGYTFGSKVRLARGGEGHFSDGFTWGGTASVSMNDFTALEFLYSRQNSTGSYDTFDYYSGDRISASDIHMFINYFEIGTVGHTYFGSSEMAEGFAGADIGAVLFSLQDNYKDAWRFAMGFKMGVKIWASDMVGINLQANLQVPVQGAGVGIYAGAGGVYTGVSSVTAFAQFGFSGGLILRFE